MTPNRMLILVVLAILALLVVWMLTRQLRVVREPLAPTVGEVRPFE